MDRYEALVAELRQEFPRFRVVHKHTSRLHRAIHHTLVVVTFGQMRTYLDQFQTTIGQGIYVTPDWDERDADERYITMRHEAVHLRQFRRWTLPGMAVLYVLLPLPLGLAYFRARFEQEAYAESVRATAEVYGIEAARSPVLRAHILGQFTGAAYGWMWPFRRQLDRWYDGVLAKLDADPGSGVG
ncbi:MAG: hypothetical protein KA297_22085 [Kofleriaceae bacterium]|nr:hypothetical protein [Kofleriaceae bacterium]MBP6838688.1 hypothetical protein [Kofleriaceae bacterium]